MFENVAKCWCLKCVVTTAKWVKFWRFFIIFFQKFFQNMYFWKYAQTSKFFECSGIQDSVFKKKNVLISSYCDGWWELLHSNYLLGGFESTSGRRNDSDRSVVLWRVSWWFGFRSRSLSLFSSARQQPVVVHKNLSKINR